MLCSVMQLCYAIGSVSFFLSIETLNLKLLVIRGLGVRMASEAMEILQEIREIKDKIIKNMKSTDIMFGSYV